VTPGVYVLSAAGPVARASLPARLGALRFDEYHAPPADTLPEQVEWLGPEQLVAGRAAEVAVRVVDPAPPDSVTLWARPVGGGGWFRAYPMRPAGAYEYRATLPADSVGVGVYEYAVTVVRGRAGVTYPGRLRQRPWDWNFGGREFWRASAVPPDAPLRLLAPAADAGRMAFTRVGDAGRQGLFRLVPASGSGEPALRVELPAAVARGIADYTASLPVGDRVAARGEAAGLARRLTVRARGLTAGEVLHVALVERDGTSWEAAVPVDTAWAERTVTLAALRPARAAALPQGFPGDWNYWHGAAAGRGGAGDAVRPAQLDRVQLSLRGPGGGAGAAAGAGTAGARGFEVEWVRLEFR
jgi:hypothetical protein